MSADLALPAPVVVAAPARGFRSPRAVIVGLTAYKAARSGVVWGYIFGAVVASSALSYSSVYKTQAQRDHVASLFGSNAATAALAGPGINLQTVAGYTAWKTLLTLAIAGGVWGLLLATRLLRGEEDAGRWELLLSGQTTPRRAVGQVLAGLSVGLGALWTVSALIIIVVGHSSKVGFGVTESLYFALAAVTGAAMFLGIGALASQLAATRRQAAGYAGVVLGVGYAIRMVADSSAGLGWMRWLSPLGWIEELKPLTHPDPLALLPIIGLTVATSALAVHLAASRDLGASVLPDRSVAPPHTRLLSGPIALATRLGRPALLGWWTAVALTSLLLGLITKAGSELLSSSSSIEHLAERLGATGSEAYLGYVFIIVAILVALVATGQVTAVREEEAEGHLDNLLVRPLARRPWLVGRVVLAAVFVVLAGLLAGLFSWLGATSQGAGVGFAALVGAGLNIAVPALFFLGVGIATFGLWPRATTSVTYGVFAWSILVELVGGVGGIFPRLLDTSVFHQMAAAPAVSPNWTANAVMLGIAVAAAAIGIVAFARRDLRGA